MFHELVKAQQNPIFLVKKFQIKREKSKRKEMVSFELKVMEIK